MDAAVEVRNEKGEREKGKVSPPPNVDFYLTVKCVGDDKCADFEQMRTELILLYSAPLSCMSHTAIPTPCMEALYWAYLISIMAGPREVPAWVLGSGQRHGQAEGR